MKTKTITRILFITTFFIIFTATIFIKLDFFGGGFVFLDKEEPVSYNLVEPTKEELLQVEARLGTIFGMNEKDYDSGTDNMYEHLFEWNWLAEVAPEYNNEIEEYIELRMRTITSTGQGAWNYTVYENDPLGRFDKIPEYAYDENGVVDESLLNDIKGLNLGKIVLGHNVFSGRYIDWLVEGVWNGKIDHDTFFELEDGTKCYYHKGFYFTPEGVSGRGGPIFEAEIESVTPIGDLKYEVKYSVPDENDEIWRRGTATIAMKEASNGFRFWSIYSIKNDK